MKKTNNIYLIGPMGSGKTSVGLQLAKKTKKNFYDSDKEIEYRSGVKISWIFEVETEAGFRIREAKIIEELTHLDNIVLATGGGCILNANNRKHLTKNGIVIYLRVSLPEQVRRTEQRRGTRPLVNVPNPEAKLAELNEIREPLYLEIADFTYDTDSHTPRKIASQIMQDVCGTPDPDTIHYDE